MSETTQTKVPARPTRNDPAILGEVANRLADDVLKWLGDKHTKREEVVSDLIKCIRGGYSNGYAIARDLERRCGYDPNSELVDILDGAPFYDVHKSAVKAWVAEHAITAAFAVGAEVDTPHGRGEITQVNADIAEYLVRLYEPPNPHSGDGYIGHCIDFEAAKAVEAVSA